MPGCLLRTNHQSPDSVNDGEDVGFTGDEQLLTIDGDLGAAVFSVQHLVADLDVHGDALVLLEAPGTNGDDLALLRLLFRGIRDVEPAAHLLRFLQRLDDDAISQRCDLHTRGALRGHTVLPSVVRGCDVIVWEREPSTT